MIVSIRSIRKFQLLAAALLALALAGCGGDDEAEPRASTEPPPASTAETATEPETEPAPAPDPETETLPDDGDGTGTGSPESGTGGAGDEEPARTLALFTGANGRITPRVIRVPAFISIRVELRSADGERYTLTFGDKALQVTDELVSVSSSFDGLRPGAALVGKAGGTGAKVRVEATAEPGP
jgi:hypothetical protein